MEKTSQKLNLSSETIGAIFIVIFMALYILLNLTIGFIWPIFILTMVIGFGISLIYPHSGLFAIVFLTIVFERFFTLQTFFIGKAEYKIYPLDILMTGILLSIIVQYLLGKAIKLRKIDWVLIGFIILNFVYFFSSVFVLKTDATLAFSTFKNYAFYSLFYFIIVFLIRTQNDMQRLFRFFLAGCVAIIAFFLIGIVNGEGLWSQYTPLSTGGVRILAFTHGFYMTLALFPAILYLIFQKTKSKLFYILIALWTLGIVGTLMRHLWIAIALVLVALYLFLPTDKKVQLRKKIWHYSLILGMIAIVLLYAITLLPQSKLNNFAEDVFGVVSQRVASLSSVSADESFSWRNLVWKGSYEKFKASPAFGIGTGQKIYVEDGYYKDFIEIRNIHNSYLAILIQMGTVGFGTLLYFLYKTVKNLLQSIGNNQYEFYKFSVLAVIGIFLISVLFQPYLETNLLAIFFWMSLGLARILTKKK